MTSKDIKPLELELLRVEFRREPMCGSNPLDQQTSQPAAHALGPPIGTEIKAIDQINQTFSLRVWLQFHIKLEPLEGKVQKELMVGLKDKDDSPPLHRRSRARAGTPQICSGTTRVPSRRYTQPFGTQPFERIAGRRGTVLALSSPLSPILSRTHTLFLCMHR